MILRIRSRQNPSFFFFFFPSKFLYSDTQMHTKYANTAKELKKSFFCLFIPTRAIADTDSDSGLWIRLRALSGGPTDINLPKSYWLPTSRSLRSLRQLTSDRINQNGSVLRNFSNYRIESDIVVGKSLRGKCILGVLSWSWDKITWTLFCA